MKLPEKAKNLTDELQYHCGVNFLNNNQLMNTVMKQSLGGVL